MRNCKGILPKMKTKPSGNRVSESLKQEVIEFYLRDENSRMCPGMKDYKAVDCNGERIQVQKRLLLGTISELYHAFSEENASRPGIGRSKFAELRPPYCIPVTSSGSHNVCVCIYHENAKLMIKGSMLKLSYKELMAMIVCSINNEICMVQRCINCPDTSNLQDFLITSIEEEYVRFSTWETTDGSYLLTKELHVNNFIDLLVTSIKNLCKHHFISQKQAEHFEYVKTNLIDNEQCLVNLDFAQNFTYAIQNEVQSHYWHRGNHTNQVTLHPFVVYFKSNNEIHHKSFCIFSDYLVHNAGTVYVFISKIIPLLKECLPRLKKIFYFSDGAGSQYKNRFNFANLACHKDEYAIDAEWHFSASCHGKGPCDGIGGCVKRLAYRESLRRDGNNQITNVQSLIEWAIAALPNITAILVLKNEAEVVVEKLKKRFSRARKIKGTRDFHSFTSNGDGTLTVKIISDPTSTLPTQHFTILSKTKKNNLIL